MFGGPGHRSTRAETRKNPAFRLGSRWGELGSLFRSYEEYQALASCGAFTSDLALADFRVFQHNDSDLTPVWANHTA